jgi:hypothetical protein
MKSRWALGIAEIIRRSWPKRDYRSIYDKRFELIRRKMNRLGTGYLRCLVGFVDLVIQSDPQNTLTGTNSDGLFGCET